MYPVFIKYSLPYPCSGKCQEILESICHIEPSNYLSVYPHIIRCKTLIVNDIVWRYFHCGLCPHFEYYRRQQFIQAKVCTLNIIQSQDTKDLSRRIAYFPTKHKLTITMPSEAHQVLINPISSSIEAAINTIEYSSAILDFSATPDLQMLIDVVSPDPDIAANRTLWAMEVTFSQSDNDIKEQLHSFITNSSDLIVVSKLLVKESRPLHPQGKNHNSLITCGSQRCYLMAKYCHNGIHPICMVPSWSQAICGSPLATSNFMFGSVGLAGLQLTWKIQILKAMHVGYVGVYFVWYFENAHFNPYVQRLFPFADDDVGNVNEVFQSGLQQVKDTILYCMTHLRNATLATDSSDMEEVLRCIQEWTPPKVVLSKTGLMHSLSTGIWETGFQRYKKWHKSLLKGASHQLARNQVRKRVSKLS